MINTDKLLASIILVSSCSIALPAAAVDLENSSISTDELTLAQFQSELNSLTANLNALENRLATIEDQRSQTIDTAAIISSASTSTSAQLDRAIEALLRQVTEQ